MKWRIGFFLLVSLAAVAENKIKYPVVRVATGRVLLVDKNGTEKALKKSEILKEKALVRTAGKSILQIDLDEHSSLSVLENSEVSIPGISWDDGSTERIDLNHGDIRYRVLGASSRVVASPITADAYVDSEFIMSYLPQLGRTEFLVLNGAVRFRGLENEEDVILKRGQKGAFQGVLEAGVPTFDILLKGRRVARGKLAPVETLSEKELEKFEKKTETKSLVKALAPAPVVRQPKQICEKPFAELNQCAWICEGNKADAKKCDVHSPKVQCVRKICNANGQWADPFIYPPGQSRCQTKPIIGPCDY